MIWALEEMKTRQQDLSETHPLKTLMTLLSRLHALFWTMMWRIIEDLEGLHLAMKFTYSQTPLQ